MQLQAVEGCPKLNSCPLRFFAIGLRSQMRFLRPVRMSGMSATDISSSFRTLDINDRIKLLGELWDEVSAETALFELSEDERRELERCYADHHAFPESSRTWAEVLAALRGNDLPSVC